MQSYTRRSAAAWFGLALLAGPATADPAGDQAGAAIVVAKSLIDLATKGRCADEVKAYRQFESRPKTAPIPPEARSDITRATAFCADKMEGQGELALTLSRAGLALSAVDPLLLHIRLRQTLNAELWPEAVETLEAMAQVDMAIVNDLDWSWLSLLDQKLTEAGDKPTLHRMLKVLAREDYAPTTPGQPADDFKRGYAIALAEAGDKAGAQAVVARIDEPEIFVLAMLDPRLRDPAAGSVDARSVVERHLARLQPLAVANPKRLLPSLQVAQDLMSLGEAERALEVLQAHDLSDAKAARSFEDAADEANWWWDTLARVNIRLGRYDQAVAATRFGVKAGEHGDLNVSQVINLAERQNLAGRSKEALETLALNGGAGGPMSPYGRMQWRSEHACANAFLGRPADAKADLDYLLAHEKDAPNAVVQGLMCVGDMDGAATAEIRRLEDADQRADALLALSDFDPPPATALPDRYQTLLDGLKTRADVRAAIDRAGGARRFNIQR